VEVLSLRALALLVLLAWLPGASAGEFSAEWGQCRFALEANGTFYQNDRYTRNYMTPRCATLGIADRFGDGPWGWRVAVLWTSYIQARDNITTVFDDDAFQHNLTCNNVPIGGRGCLANINGDGHTYGISVGGTYQHRLGILTLTGEAGLFFFRHSFHAQFRHTDCDRCHPLGSYDESSGPFTNPSPLLGLTFRVGAVYFAARHYWPAEHRALSLTNHSFTQLSSGFVVRY
jgi:hypothetical protein